MCESIKSTYNGQDIEFIRRIDQSIIKLEKRIAIDDGVPLSQLNLEDLKEIVSKTFCEGTYSHFCQTLDGQKTQVAIQVIKSPSLKKQ